MLSLTCDEKETSQGALSQDACSVASDPCADDDVWWSSECHDLTDVISVLSRQVSRDIYTVSINNVPIKYSNRKCIFMTGS